MLDEVLLVKLDPQTLQGEVRNLYGHKFVCLNPNPNTPKEIRDWLDLIYQSIHSPERTVLNMQNEGIKKAVELISFDNLTPEERTELKNKKEARITLVKTDIYARQEVAKALIADNIPSEKNSKIYRFDNRTSREIIHVTFNFKTKPITIYGSFLYRLSKK